MSFLYDLQLETSTEAQLSYSLTLILNLWKITLARLIIIDIFGNSTNF